MDLVPDDKKKGLKTPVWDEYKAIINESENRQVIRRPATGLLYT